MHGSSLWTRLARLVRLRLSAQVPPAAQRLRPSWVLPLIGCIALIAPSCADPEPPKPAPTPRIISFNPNPSTIATGERSTLSWIVEDVTQVTVLDPKGTVLGTFERDGALSGSVDVSPSETTTYTLEAINAPSGEKPSPPQTATTTVTIDTLAAPTLTLNLTPNTIIPGQDALLQWTTTNTTGLALTANGTGVPLDSETSQSGSLTVSPSETTLYSMTATGPGGTTVQAATLTVEPAANITSFSASPTQIAPNEESTLSWTTAGADQITLSANGSPLDITGKNPTQDSITIQPSETTTYTLTATGTLGEDTSDVIVTVVENPTPTISSFTADPSEVLRGEESTLSWTTNNADTIEILAADTLIHTETTNLSSGSITVNPTETTIYTLRATNDAGTSEETTSILIAGDPSPVLSVGLSTDTIDAGQNATLSWQTANVTSLRVEADPPPSPDITNLPRESGEIQINPTATTAYTVIASGPGGEVRDTVTLNVNPAVNIASFTTNSAQIEFGEPVELSWNVEHAQDVTLSYDTTTDTVPPQGSRTINELAETTTFTLTANGIGGPITRTLTVNVRLPGTPDIRNFVPAPQTANIDDTVSISWSVAEATSLTLTATPEGRDPVEIDITDQPLDVGSVTVTPRRSTTYTLTASNVSGSSQATADVLVPLEIISLTPPQNAVNLGEDATVSWRIQGATRATLQRGTAQPTGVNFDDEGNGQLTLTNITDTTPITLRAFDINDNPTSATAVIALAMPTITNWTASPPAGTSGASFTLEYTTTNATSVSISGLDSQGETITVNTSNVDPAGDSVQVTLEYTATFTLTARNASDSTTAQTQITITNEPAPAEILSFTADPLTVNSGENTTLRWTTNGATALRIETTSGPDLPPLFIPPNNLDSGDAIIEDIFEDRTLTLIATGTDGSETQATVNLSVNVDLSGVVLSEVFYNAPSEDNNLEWVELYHSGDAPINLALLKLGFGGGSFAQHTVDLPNLVIFPGDCVVLGGPTSSAANANPIFDAPFDIDPDLQNTSGAFADGVAIFDARNGDPTPQSPPIDAVVYGALIESGDTFTGPDGRPIPTPNTSNAPAGYSIFRYAQRNTLRSSNLWASNPFPTPGRCFGLAPARFTENNDQQLYDGRRRAPEQGGTLLGLNGFHLSTENTTVLLGNSTLDCIDDPPGGLLCEVPPGTGRADLTLRQGDRDVVYGGFFAYEAVDFCNIQFPTEPISITSAQDMPTLYGRIYEEGKTEDPIPHPDIVAQWGYGPFGSDPFFVSADWTWTPGSFNVQNGNDDEYQATPNTPPVGVYSHVWRFSTDGGSIWTYCDTNGTVNNLPNDLSNLFDPNDAGLLEVTTP